MNKMSTIRVMVLLLATGCVAWAKQPEVWIPAQQAPDTKAAQSSSSAPTSSSGQAPGEPAQTQLPGPAPTGEQPPTPNSEDPRLDQPMQPIAPAQPDSNAAQTAPAAGAATVIPDNTPLNSPYDLTLGTPSGGSSGRSTMVPSLRVSTSLADTSGIAGVGSEVLGNMSGRVQMTHSWAHSSLNFDYLAGGNLYSQETNLNGSYQTYSLGMRFHPNHWDLSLVDTGSYLPGSSFGFYGTQFIPGTAGMGTGYVPNQSILTENVDRLSNTVMGQAVYHLGARTTLHMSSGWGIIRFQGGGATALGGLINENDLEFGGGIDRQIGGKTTLGIGYDGTLYTYGGTSRSLNAHNFLLSYARRVTGKLALQLSGGPALRTFDDPVLGSESGVGWNVRTGLTYQVGRTLWSSSFVHYTSGGSGVLGGADTSQWSVAVSRTFARQWTVMGDFGIAKNSSLFGAALGTVSFDSQFAGLQINRVLNREWNVFFNYNLQHETSTLPLCLGCGDSFTRHIVGVGFEWNGRPRAGLF